MTRASPPSPVSESSLRRLLAWAAQGEVWVVALLVGGGILSQRLLFPALIAAGFFWVLRRLGTGRWSLHTPLDWPLLLLVGMALLSLIATPSRVVTLPAVLRLFGGILLFYAIWHWAVTPRRMAWLGEGLRLVGFGLALVAPFTVQWATGKLPFIPAAIYERFTVVAGESIHPNVLAGHLVAFLLWASAPLFFAWPSLSWFKRVYYAGISVFMLGILVLSQSRGAFMGLIAAVLVLFLARYRRGWIGVSLAVVAILAVTVRFGLTAVLDAMVGGERVAGWGGRLEIWSRAVYMLQDFPFTGVGMGMFGKLADALYPFFSYSPRMVEHAHNLYLQVAVDLGLPGLVAWLAIFGLLAWCAWQLFRDGRVQENAMAVTMGAAGLASQVALAVHGMTDAVTWNLRPAALSWALWGATLAAWYLYSGQGAVKALSVRGAVAPADQEPNQPDRQYHDAQDD